MLTYVINTSENKTFDSDKLFELAGYNKIRWLNRPLNEIKLCAQHIFEKQNVLGAEPFRIAVIVDFYSFDRVRAPYGKHGFIPETGVDISLYMPYLEMFLLDNLVLYLEHQELRPEDFEIYYIQHSRLEHYEFLDNAIPQLHCIMTGVDPKPPAQKDQDQPAEAAPSEEKNTTDAEVELDDADKSLPLPPEDLIAYSSFTLYCTPSVSLSFHLYDYPYGAEHMTFPEFYRAVRERMSYSSGARCHYYITNYGGGKARAAFDALSLSLHLIRTYEREENPPEQGELTISSMDTNILKQVLETAWNKVNIARSDAKANNSQYFALESNMGISNYVPQAPHEDPQIFYQPDKGKSTEALYAKICYYHDRTPEQAAADNRDEFNQIMDGYLMMRDGTRAVDVSSEFDMMLQEGSLKMTQQCPSKEEYLYIIKKKQQEISEIFDRALSAEMIEVDYSKEKKQADNLYRKYREAKACLNRNIVGDLIFLFLSLLVVLGPYALLQLSGYTLKTPEIALLAVYTGALFVGLFILAVIIQMLPLTWKLRRLKADMRFCYNLCYQKERYSMSQIRRRYHEDLIKIERARYELRQLKHLFEANLAKEANVKRHRDMLEEVETRLSSLLNSLDVEPKIDRTESITGEFNILKPIRSRENKIYRIFSIETIERLFSKKGRDEQW